MLASDFDPLLRSEGLAKEGMTLTSDSNPLLRPEGLAKEGTTLASDSDPLLQPGIHRTSAYGSSLTGAVGADWERPTWDACSVRTQGSGGADKARRSSQPQY